MRRNRESRARIKLIQEMHLKKEAQAWIDKAVGETTFTYTDLYRYWRGWVDRGMPYTWTAKGSMARCESNGDLYTAKSRTVCLDRYPDVMGSSGILHAEIGGV